MQKLVFHVSYIDGNGILLEVIQLLGWLFGGAEDSHRQLDIEEIYLKYRKLMYATAGKFTSNLEDQKDIVQTAMERIIRIFSESDAKRCLISASYIVFTIRSVAIDLLRKQSREAEHRVSMEDEQLVNVASVAGSLDDSLLSSSSSEQLWQIWAQLSSEDRLLLEGKYIFGFSGKELASLLKCNPESIWMKLTRARRRAAKLLSERNEL